MPRQLLTPGGGRFLSQVDAIAWATGAVQSPGWGSHAAAAGQAGGAAAVAGAGEDLISKAQAQLAAVQGQGGFDGVPGVSWTADGGSHQEVPLAAPAPAAPAAPIAQAAVAPAAAGGSDDPVSLEIAKRALINTFLTTSAVGGHFEFGD